MRPRARMTPVVGDVTRESIFSSVDFPAPLRPMMPITSPSSTLKSMSLSAHT